MKNPTICTTCNGEGKVREYEIGHNPTYEFTNCTKCNGTGRMIHRSYTAWAPFGTPVNLEIDSKIHSLLSKVFKK